MGRDAERYREAERRLWASVGCAPTERVLQLSRTGVGIRVQESGTGPPVVFVHGGSTAAPSWAPLVALLPGLRCVVLDRPGCGLSPRLETGFSDVGRLETFADALVVDVLDALEIERGHVVATSFGCYFALRAAAAHPDRVNRVVQLGWTVGAPIGRTPAAMRLTSVPGLGRLLTSIPPTERAVRAIYRNVGLRGALESGRISPEGIAWFLSLLRDTTTMRNELDAGPAIVRPLRGINRDLLLADELLARITAPVLVLWGEDDPLGGPTIAEDFVARLPAGSLELIPRAGHAVWMDDPDHIATRILAFLEV